MPLKYTFLSIILKPDNSSVLKKLRSILKLNIFPQLSHLKCPWEIKGSGLEISLFIFPFDSFPIFLHININTTKVLKNPSFFRKYLRDVLVISEWYSDGKEKIDSRFRGNDIRSNEMSALSSKAHDNRRLILNIFTNKWGKSGKKECNKIYQIPKYPIINKTPRILGM